MYIKVANETAERGRKRGSRFDDGPFFLFFSLLPIVCSNGGLEVLNIPTREKTGRKSCSREQVAGGRDGFLLYFSLLYYTLLYFVKWFMLVGLKNDPFSPLFLHPVSCSLPMPLSTCSAFFFYRVNLSAKIYFVCFASLRFF